MTYGLAPLENIICHPATRPHATRDRMWGGSVFSTTAAQVARGEGAGGGGGGGVEGQGQGAQPSNKKTDDVGAGDANAEDRKRAAAKSKLEAYRAKKTGGGGSGVISRGTAGGPMEPSEDWQFAAGGGELGAGEGASDRSAEFSNPLHPTTLVFSIVPETLNPEP